jgi:hypothetical protein
MTTSGSNSYLEKAALLLDQAVDVKNPHHNAELRATAASIAHLAEIELAHEAHLAEIEKGDPTAKAIASILAKWAS